MDRWGAYARQHSQLLLQMETTNAFESFHRDIKMQCKRTDEFLAAVNILHEEFERRVTKEKLALFEMKTKRVLETAMYPQLSKFNYVLKKKQWSRN
jgi:hypothetical protein